MKEQYSIGLVNGFVVSGLNYHSKVFGTLPEAQAHQAELEKTPLREEIKVILKKDVKK